MALKDLFTTFSAAEYCNVSYMSVKRWILSGKLKAHRTPGGHFRISKSDLHEFMLKNNLPIHEKIEISRKKILIIDDDDEVRKSISTYLTMHNYEIFTAKDGFEAGFIITQQSPDLAILDLIMPQIDGFKVCSMIKNNIFTKHIKVIVLTGYANEKNIKRAYKCGADKVLSKPVEAEELFEAISSII